MRSGYSWRNRRRGACGLLFFLWRRKKGGTTIRYFEVRRPLALLKGSRGCYFACLGRLAGCCARIGPCSSARSAISADLAEIRDHSSLALAQCRTLGPCSSHAPKPTPSAPGFPHAAACIVRCTAQAASLRRKAPFAPHPAARAGCPGFPDHQRIQVRY